MSSGSSKAPRGWVGGGDFYHMSHQELPRSLIQQHFKQLWPVSRLITTTREPSEMPGECHSIRSLAGFSWSLGLLFSLSFFFFTINACVDGQDIRDGNSLFHHQAQEGRKARGFR